MAKTSISCLVNPNGAERRYEQDSPYNTGKPPTYPARCQAPTSPSAPSEVITLKLGLHRSPQASFLCTSSLRNLVVRK